MISKIVNLSTGPVGITRRVMRALSDPPVSHRSPEFERLYNQTTELLNIAFQVKQSFILTGSGTLANEAMLQEIKAINGKGLILSNGEFGSRLVDQALRNGLDFINYNLAWGQPFQMTDINKLLFQDSVKWILFCHCETSTGMINDLDELTALAKEYHCMCFVDCMSTVGTMSLNLSGITMATASSGKGLASVPGLAIVFSNVELKDKKNTPVYLDLNQYASKGGIPFTISSNVLKALHVSIIQKLDREQFELIEHYGQKIYRHLQNHALVPFSNIRSRVFTVLSPRQDFSRHMYHHGMSVSHESSYLQERGWCQLATFGYYTEKQLQRVVCVLGK